MAIMRRAAELMVNHIDELALLIAREGGKPLTDAQVEAERAVDGLRCCAELPRHSATRHLLERLRDEAHRFAITFHRKQRGRIQSQLDSIPGVGEAKRKALLRAFGSVVGVKQASVEQIGALPTIGPELARAIVEHLHGRAEAE